MNLRLAEPRLSEERSVRNRSGPRLVRLLVQAVGRSAREAMAATEADSLATSLAAVAGRLRYLWRVHRSLAATDEVKATPRLLDAFAWGLSAFIQDRALRPDTRSPETTALGASLREGKAYLEAHRVTIPSKTALMKRAETHHASIGDPALREATELGIRRAAERALRDARQPEQRGPTATDSAAAVSGELMHVWAAFGGNPKHQSQASIVVLSTVLEPAIGELVRWADADRVETTPEWTALFAIENDFRDQARLDLKERSLALRASPAEIVAMLRQAPSGDAPSSVDAAISHVGVALEDIANARKRAVRNLERKLKEPPPPADGSTVLAVLSVALSVAVAGVGGMIASYVVARVRNARIYPGYDADVIPMVKSLDAVMKFEPAAVESHVDGALSEAVQALVGGVVPVGHVLGWLADGTDKPASDTTKLTALTARLLRDPRNVFAAELEHVLDEIHSQTQRRLIDRKPILRTVPIEQLQRVEQRLRAIAVRAEDAQLYTAMIEWMNFVARWQLGPIAGTKRGATLSVNYYHHDLAGVVTIDCLIDRARPRTGRVTLHDGRAGIEDGVWKAIQQVAGDTPVSHLPVNKVYRFFVGTPRPGPSDIVIRVQAPAGASIAMDDYGGQGRRALAACALDLPYSPALEGAIRHGRRAPHDEGVALARQLAKVPVRDLVRVRHELVIAAAATSIAQVRSAS